MGASVSLGANGRFVIDYVGSDRDPRQQMQELGTAVTTASAEAVSRTSEELKERARDFLDAHFTGSSITRNGRTRASNTLRVKTYNELDGRGKYTEIVYSELGRGHGPSSFVDYLLLHLTGGEIAPNRGQWLTIFNPALDRATARAALTGNFPGANSQVFFVKSADGEKLYLLRKYGNGGSGSLGRSTQLIATLVRSVHITASLSGLEAIAAERDVLFPKNFDAALNAATTKGAGA